MALRPLQPRRGHPAPASAGCAFMYVRRSRAAPRGVPRLSFSPAEGLHHPSAQSHLLKEDFYPALPATHSRVKTTKSQTPFRGGRSMCILSRAWKLWTPIKFLLHCTSFQGMLWAGNCRVSALSPQAQPGLKLFLVDICICIALELRCCCPTAAPSVPLYTSISISLYLHTSIPL